MDYTLLDELVAIQKKSEAPKTKRAQYATEMAKLLASEGLSEHAVQYLKAGAAFSAALPFVEYIKPLSPEERSKQITTLFTSTFFRGSDKPNAFRYAISLLGYSVTWFLDDITLFVETIKIIPPLAYNKEKHLLKDAPKTVERFFLKYLKVDTVLPPLDSIGLKDIFVKEFRHVMIESVNLVPSPSLVKDHVLAWLSQKAGTETPITDKKQSIDTQGKSDTVIPEEGDKSDQKLIEPLAPAPMEYTKYGIRELDQIAIDAESFVGRLRASIKFFADEHKETVRRQETIDALERELSSGKKKLDEAVATIARLEKDNAVALKTISELRVQLMDSKRDNTEQAHQLYSLQQEVEKLNSVISVFNADKQNSQSEQLNAIASKLKAEYVDFKEAEQDSMTLDLGENFRCQLQSVFRILAKAGIDVEKR